MPPPRKGLYPESTRLSFLSAPLHSGIIDIALAVPALVYPRHDVRS